MMEHNTDRDPEQVQRASSVLRFALRRVAARPGDPGTLAEALYAIGELVVLDQAESLDRHVARGLVEASDVGAILDRGEMEEALEVSAARLWERLRAHEEVAVGEPDPGFEETVTALLQTRDRAELELLGAAAALGCSPEEVESRSTVRLVFDQVVRPEVWRLVELNEARTAALARVLPRLRARFWWWHAGAGVHPEAAAQMAAVAQLVASFPEARLRFEGLVRAQTAWAVAARTVGRDGAAGGPKPLHAARTVGRDGAAGGPKPPRAARTVGPDGAAGGPIPPRAARTLRAWLLRRASVGGTAMLPLAAAPEDERTVLETADVEVSFSPPASLIVDLLSDRREGAQPSLMLPSGAELVTAPVEGAEERFVFELPEGALDGEEVSLRLPLAGGDLTLALPPRGDA